jgi:hypothetical protein
VTLRAVLGSLARVALLVVLLLVAGIIALALTNNQPVEFASGLLAVAGAVGGFTALTYAHAASLEGQHRVWFNREAKNLFQGAMLWGYAALLAYLYHLMPTTTLPAWLASVLLTLMTCLLGLLIVFAALVTMLTADWILEGLGDPADLEALQRRTSKGRIARVLGRSA